MMTNKLLLALNVTAALGLAACGGGGGGGDADAYVIRSLFAVGDVVDALEDGGPVEGDVSSNDQGENISYALASGSSMANGSLQFNSDGSFTYTPNDDFYGSDTVDYVATLAATGETDTATLTINVENDFERLEEYGWGLVWSDEFNSPGLDTDLWTGVNASVAGGNLVISSQQGATSSVTALSSLKYGRIEASMKAAAGTDILAAMHLAPVADQYEGSNLLSALHSANGSAIAGAHYGLGITSGIRMNGEVVESIADEFHRYAIEWGANEIRWYIDGAHVHTVDGLHTWAYNVAGNSVVADNAGPFNQDMQIVLQLEAGAESQPAEIVVDYIKAWVCDPSVESSVDECASYEKTKVSKLASDRIESVGAVTTEIYNNGYYDSVTGAKLADLQPLVWHDQEEAGELSISYLNEPEVKSVTTEGEHGAVLDITNEAGLANIAITTPNVELIGHNLALNFDLFINSADTTTETVTVKMQSGETHGGVISWNLADMAVDNWVSYSIPLSDFVDNPMLVDGEPMPLDLSQVSSLMTLEVMSSAHLQLDNVNLSCINAEGCVQAPLGLQSEAAPKAEPIRYEAEDYIAESGTGIENTSDEGGGQNVAFIGAGDFLVYSISAPGIGPYSLDYRVASAGGSEGFEVSIDGVLVDSQTIPDTGDWQNWTTLTSTQFDLVVGIYTLRIDFLGDSQNLNWFELLPPVTEIFVEAEDFDDESGISLEDTTDDGGGENIGYIDEGDYVEYSINIPSDGTYLIEYRLASAVDSDGFETSIGGVVVDTQTLVATGDWQNWITQSAEVELTAGEKIMRLDFLGGAINVNWIRLTRQ